MKIITLLRTRNESLNIERFCESYTWVNKILIADGGSEDNTIELARQYKNVEVRKFTKQVDRKGEWRNPHGEHINYMIEWAELYSPDWIIFDDCDCVPNYAIKEEWERLFLDAEEDGNEFILANRVYIYGKDQYFHDLTCPKVLAGKYEDKYIPSLWAWKSGLGFRASEDDPFKHEFNRHPTDFPRKELYSPYCLLHYFYPNDEYMKRKLAFYNAVYEFGSAVKVRDPKDFGGQLLPLEKWMKE